MDDQQQQPAIVATERTPPAWRKKLLVRGPVLLSFILICWLVVIYDKVAPTKDSMLVHGIIPRQSRGLLGIMISPIIHVGFSHVATNTVGILILGTILMLYSLTAFFGVTAFVWLVGGFLTWCVGRSGYSVVGASGIVFGWFGYLIVTPFITRPFSFKGLALAVVAGVSYVGLIFGVFPKDPRVAWEANICGLISGVLCSVLYWLVYQRIIRAKFGNKDPNNLAETQGLLAKNQQNAQEQIQVTVNPPFTNNNNTFNQPTTFSNPSSTSVWAPTTNSMYSSQQSTNNPYWLTSDPEKAQNYNKSSTTVTSSAPFNNTSSTTTTTKQPDADPFAFIIQPSQNNATNNSNSAVDEIFNPFTAK